MANAPVENNNADMSFLDEDNENNRYQTEVLRPAGTVSPDDGGSRGAAGGFVREGGDRG